MVRIRLKSRLANEVPFERRQKKALELLRELAKSEKNTTLIYNNYFNVMLDMGAHEDALNYLKKI